MVAIETYSRYVLSKYVWDPNSSKQAQEVIFTWKFQKLNYPALYFNNASVNEYSKQKHLEMFQDFKLHFQEHCKYLLKKQIKQLLFYENSKIFFLDQYCIPFINLLLELSLIMAILFVINILIILFSKKTESLQYISVLAMKGVIRWTSR